MELFIVCSTLILSSTHRDFGKRPLKNTVSQRMGNQALGAAGISISSIFALRKQKRNSENNTTLLSTGSTCEFVVWFYL